MSRESIERNLEREIQAVEDDDSLSQYQKNDQIKELYDDARGYIDDEDAADCE